MDSSNNTMEVNTPQAMDLDSPSTPLHSKTERQIDIWNKIGTP